MQDFIYYIEYYWYVLLIAIIPGLLLRGYLAILYFLLLAAGIIYSGGRMIDAGIIILFTFILRSIKIIILKKSKPSPHSPFRAEFLTDRKKKVVIEDVNAGVSVFAASGGGKSAGPIYWLGKHFAKEKFAGIINDYKNYELTEVMYPLFNANGVKLNVWAIHDPNRSVQINPIAPRYIQVESDLKQIAQALMLNLYEKTTGDGQFFINAGTSVFSAVIWRLKEDYPELCNIPFVIAILMSYKGLHETRNGEITHYYGKLIDFITQSQRATVIGNMFLSGLTNERQTGSVMSELADGLSRLASPELFYLLGEDGFDLSLNADDNRSVLSIVNYPKKEAFISPVNAMIMECCFNQMSERDRKPAFVLMDEASTTKQDKLGKKVSTLRSYHVSFVYCMQDKVQGQVQWDGREYITKEILANLSVQFMGKINDPETGRYYERFFEMVKEEQLSYNKGEGAFFSSARGENRITTSYKEVAKFRAAEFFKLRAGEFVMFSSGIAKKIRFLYEQPNKELPLPTRQITATELNKNYDEILKAGAEFLSKINLKS